MLDREHLKISVNEEAVKLKEQALEKAALIGKVSNPAEQETAFGAQQSIKAILKALEDTNRIVFRYAEGTNPNGAVNDIDGIVNEAGNVIGMMPHPENMIEPLHGNSDCRPLFESLLAA